MKTTRRLWLQTALAGAVLATGARAQPAIPTGDPLRKPIPSSGEMIPVIGIGTAVKYHNPSLNDFTVLRATMQRFLAAGGSVVDTAPAYGTAEAAVGALMQSLEARKAIFVATKVGAVGRDEGRAQIERSFQQLRTDRIDLIAVHNLRDVETQLPTLREYRDGGRVRYVGITTSSERQYADFERTMKEQSLDFIQVDYAIDNRGAAERILPLARERGMATMINLPFGRGRLFRAVRGKALPEWAAEIDCDTWAQFFLKYIVSHEAVTCAIPGTSKPEHAVDNAGAARGRMPDAAMRRRMEAFVDAL